MVLWSTDKSRNMQITRDNVAAALMEAAHHPREKFDWLETRLKRATMRADIPWVAHTYDEYRQMFWGRVPGSALFRQRVQEVVAESVEET
jgi:hypothetical protein